MNWSRHADDRLDAPAFHRNRDAIVEVLRARLANTDGDLLEVGSGSGQHALAIARALPNLRLWPTDPDAAHVASANAWRDRDGPPNLQPARQLDATATDWGVSSLRAVFCANVIHIAPWEVAEGLFAGAAHHLDPRGELLLYGPFSRAGVHTAASNAAFDDSLKSRDPRWGVRDLDDLVALGNRHRLHLEAEHPMPANNHLLAFRLAP